MARERLDPGQKRPHDGELSKILGVSMNTVNRAKRELYLSGQPITFRPKKVTKKRTSRELPPEMDDTFDAAFDSSDTFSSSPSSHGSVTHWQGQERTVHQVPLTQQVQQVPQEPTGETFEQWIAEDLVHEVQMLRRLVNMRSCNDICVIE